MGYDIRIAVSGDEDACARIFDQARARMGAMGLDQWQNGYPNRHSASDDIKAGVGRVLTDDGRVIGYAALILSGEPTYARIYDGAWMGDGAYGVIHRVAIADTALHKGVGDVLLGALEDECAFKGFRFARIDTHADNAPMRALLSRRGYTRCGRIYIADGSPREAYEKRLKP